MSSFAIVLGPFIKAARINEPMEITHAADTDARSLEQALVGADIFLGLSVADAVKKDGKKHGPTTDYFCHGKSNPGNHAR